MRYLLDTHVLLWWLDDSSRLSNLAKEIIIDPNNLIFVSSVSTWEITIKKASGKLIAPDNLEKTILDCSFRALPITIKHTLHLENLDKYHSDPFDRLLICQAITENLILITSNTLIEKYQISTLKA